MFFFLGFVLAVVILSVALTRGPQEGLWYAWWLAILTVPCWVTYRVGASIIDYRTVAAACALAAFPLSKARARLDRPVFGDLVMVLLCVSVSVSQVRAKGFGTFTVLDLASFWLLPYLVGRLFLRSSDDVPRTLRIFCVLCVATCALAVLEAVVKINPTAVAFGRTFGMLETGEGYRMGLKRAHGPVSHPISFGLLLTMMLPWAVEAGRLARSPRGLAWWRVVPLAAGAGILASNSRGAWLASLATCYWALFFMYPKFRLPVGAFGVIVALVAPYAQEAILSLLSSAAGGEELQTVTLNGIERPYTGTLHRVLLFEVYAEEMDEAGWFGYGKGLTGIELDETESKFWSIDCHYLAFLLRYGYAGIGLFCLSGLVSLFYLARAAWKPSRPMAHLSGWLFGAVVGLSFALITVWLPTDFGAAWVFCMGLASNFAAAPARPEQDAAGPSPPPPPRRKSLRFA